MVTHQCTLACKTVLVMAYWYILVVGTVVVPAYCYILIILVVGTVTVLTRVY